MNSNPLLYREGSPGWLRFRHRESTPLSVFAPRLTPVDFAAPTRPTSRLSTFARRPPPNPRWSRSAGKVSRFRENGQALIGSKSMDLSSARGASLFEDRIQDRHA